MRLWYAMVGELSAFFDPGLHCLPAGVGFSMRIAEVEGQQATIEIEREQRGWSILAREQPRNILVSWSPTGDPADAVLLARGRINELPSDLMANRQTIRAICSPDDIDKELLTWAKENKVDGPWTDALFSDFDLDNPESYLLGRSETFRVDATTHEISTVDDLVGDRTWDLSGVALFEGGSLSDAPGVYDPPAKRLKANLAVDWTQVASGRCNIGPYIGVAGLVSSLDPSWGSNLSQFLSSEDAAGWSLGGTEIDKSVTLATTLNLSYLYKTYYQSSFVSLARTVQPDGSDATELIWSAEPVLSDKTTNSGHHGFASVAAVFEVYHYILKRFDLNYSYSQPRQEILNISLDVPVQDGIVVDDEDPEAVELSLKSVFEDPQIAEWKVETDYKKGDLVYSDGKVYVCNGDHTSVYFDQVRDPPIEKRIEDGFLRYTQKIVIYWERYYPKDLPNAETMVSFFDTTRGQSAVEHVYCRLRKDARRRMRVRHLTFSCRWQDAIHVQMTDSVSITVPWSDGSARVVTGKVVARELVWNGDGQPMVNLEIGVSFGDGSTDDRIPQDQGYVESGYVRSGYVESAGRSDFDVLHIEVPETEVYAPIDTNRLHSGGYSLITSQLGNLANEQLSYTPAVVDDGGNAADVSVRYPTWLRLRLRSLASDSTIVRVIDGAGQLLVAPMGVDLG